MALTDGRQLHYHDCGSGPVLVLLHGWAMTSGVFAGVLDDLKKEFRLLVPDLRGHGRSAAGPGYALCDFTADLNQWLHRLGVERCSLLGWSFGGQLAMQMAADAALDLERLVLVSTTPRFCRSDDWEHGLPQGQVRAMARQLRRDPTATLNDFVQLMFDEQVSAGSASVAVLQALEDPDLKGGQQTLQTLAEADLRERVADIDVPTLVQHGGDDRIIPVAAGEYLYERLPRAERAVWDGIGHAPFVSCVERSLSLWREFLL